MVLDMVSKKPYMILDMVSKIRQNILKLQPNERFSIHFNKC